MYKYMSPVPARVGGVDLSTVSRGFFRNNHVPARVGGVDLSETDGCEQWELMVPARVGGVDLSKYRFTHSYTEYCPRPCGRGGFKPTEKEIFGENTLSPPVWAGWI